MRKVLRNGLITALVLGLLLSGISCTQKSSVTPTPAPTPTTPTTPTPTPAVTPAPTSTPAVTPILQGETIVVTSTADSSPGTLRQALLDAESGDTITFDSAVFPPSSPATIYLSSPCPPITQGNLMIDASNAGVILDGRKITTPESVDGLSISSNSNTIRGLQIIGFSDAGIALGGGASYNVIGGDRGIGAGPLGQGNVISGNGNFGIGLWDEGTSHNTIQGNYIGINLDGTATWGHSRDGIHSNGANYNVITGNVIGGNEAGVYLCCVTDGRNIVSANIIGTDESGENPLGNRLAGVLIDRTSYNVVGPGNLIAYNDGQGIMFWDDTAYNTVSQNSIHDNGEQGIDQGGAMVPPNIFEFNLQAGNLAGGACANCTVEIFSDSSDEGAIYEGQTKADSNGAFTFSKGVAFTGPHLTATSTAPDGSTSELSAPTLGSGESLILQEENNLPKTAIHHKNSKELEDNRIGGVAETRHVGDWVWTTGLKWMRVICDPYGRWQTVDWGKEEYAIDSNEEGLINDLLSNNVKIMLVLDVWYPENRIVYYKTEADIERYLNYVRFMVNHFKGRIEYYEILNEPNLDFSAPSGLPLSYYVNLIKRTVPVIREEDAEAKIVVGAIPDIRFDDCRDYMWGLLRSAVMPLVDGFSWHGMYGAAPSDDPRGVRQPQTPQMANYWENYPSLVKEIIDVASSSGFKGEFFVEEMLWRTLSEPHDSEPYGFNDVAGAKYYARAIIMHLGLNVTTGLAVVHSKEREQSHAVIRVLSTVMAGAEPTTLSVEIDTEATNIRHYSFSLPNGDRLIALWTDGIAADDDPAVEATVTIPRVSAKKVTGIDVLHSFEQQMITDVQDGNLVIRNLMIKDYPLILRVED